MRNFKNYILIAVIAVLFNSCAKDGAPGATGPQGAPGNANVSSSTYNVASSDWIYDGTNNRYYVSLNVQGITSNVMSNGTVNVFVGNGSGTYWNAMPYSLNDNEYNAQILIGLVYIYYHLGSGGIPPAPTGSATYKVVVIP